VSHHERIPSVVQGEFWEGAAQTLGDHTTPGVLCGAHVVSHGMKSERRYGTGDFFEKACVGGQGTHRAFGGVSGKRTDHVTEGVVKWEQPRVYILWAAYNSTAKAHHRLNVPVQPMSNLFDICCTGSPNRWWVFRFFSMGPTVVEFWCFDDFFRAYRQNQKS
jgi:hypothetical protein